MSKWTISWRILYLLTQYNPFLEWICKVRWTKHYEPRLYMTPKLPSSPTIFTNCSCSNMYHPINLFSFIMELHYQSGVLSFIHFSDGKIMAFWPGDAIWRHRPGFTLAQVMACYRVATPHYLGQYWLIIKLKELFVIHLTAMFFLWASLIPVCFVLCSFVWVKLFTCTIMPIKVYIWPLVIRKTFLVWEKTKAEISVHKCP